MKRAPQWAIEELDKSAGPRWIIEGLKQSEELAELWNQVPDQWRKRIVVLPEYLGGIKPSQKLERLPYDADNTPTEQAAQASKVAWLAKELNRELLLFKPMTPHGRLTLYALLPGLDDAMTPGVRVGVPFAGKADSLLRRVERSALGYKPTQSSLVKRPGKPGAYTTYLMRAVHRLLSRAKWEDAAALIKFAAGIVNVLDPSPDRDFKTLESSIRTKGPRAAKSQRAKSDSQS